MIFYVNEHCIGCDLCIEVCPAVFSLTEFGSAEAIPEDVPQEHIPDARHAQDNCPAFAIEILA
ncbi:MAG: ferredoxin [Oscillospiraceae bacterium]|nr:ferredoxin [Oscillospiraceae bacterium]